MSRMRLICPNCGAQYEVPIEVIPEGGRDVQCSSCGHTWFQRHPDDDPDLAEELNEPLPDQSWAPEDEPMPEPEPDVTPRRQIDPDMAALFAEERDLEIRRRQAEVLETQPELGLGEPDEDEAARRSREARERMARLRGEDPEGERPRPATPRPDIEEPEDEHHDAGRAAAEAAAAAAAAGSRRDLLPNVDEINQTLRSGADPRTTREADDTDTPSSGRRSGGGFSRGFFLIIVLVGLAIALYAYGPTLSETVPQAAPLLDAYVAQVDTGRVWLDEQVTALMQSLDGMSSEATPEAE